MAVSKATRLSLRWGREEEDELADSFLEAKVYTYIETLEALAIGHGYELGQDEIELSDAVLLDLRREARRNAGRVVSTFNADLDTFLARSGDFDRETVLTLYDQWADDRAEKRAEVIAVTEAFPAHADATMAFYRDNGVEPTFTFGVHGPADAPAECVVCQALVDDSPHPLARVLEIGTPHIGCRQSWRADEEADGQLPDELVLGVSTAGIVGSEPLVNRTGDHASAAEFVRGEPTPAE